MNTLEKKALRYNEGKPPISLVHPDAIKAMAAVLDFGARKYGRHNWTEGFEWSCLYDSMQRHMLAWNEGTDIDDESGLPHTWHAMTNMMMLVVHERRGLGRDDRLKLGDALPFAVKQLIDEMTTAKVVTDVSHPSELETESDFVNALADGAPVLVEASPKLGVLASWKGRARRWFNLTELRAQALIDTNDDIERSDPATQRSPRASERTSAVFDPDCNAEGCSQGCCGHSKKEPPRTGDDYFVQRGLASGPFPRK